MLNKFKFLLSLITVICSTLLLSGCNVVMLNPKGIIALQERDLISTALGLMLIIVIPTFILTFVIARRYRASNTKAKYDPSFTHSTLIEVICWGVPCIIVAIIAIITWISSHELDPYKPLESDVKPLTIQVVSLDWKWLFIYPEQNIATVNFVQFPVNVPINFKITSDAPMNSFWIPQLSGQVYSMTGMQTQLHIMATELGDYHGNSASYSGAGFSGMKFIARVSTQDEFDTWVNQVKASHNDLTGAKYVELAKPTEKETPVIYYSSVRDRLYNDIIMKFMMPGIDLTKPTSNMDFNSMHM